MIEESEPKEEKVYPKIEFDINDLQVVSVNDMYAVRRGRGRSVFRSAKYEAFAEAMTWQIRVKVPRKQIDNFIHILYNDKGLGVRFSMLVEMPEGKFFRTDSSNLIKSFEDVVKNYFLLDDSRNCTVIVEKRICPEKKWNTKVKLEIYELPFPVKKDKWQRVVAEEELKWRKRGVG